MKNRDEFAIFQKRLEPWFGDRGFVAARDPHSRATWGWTRPEKADHLNYWWQGENHPFDLDRFYRVMQAKRSTKPDPSPP